MIISKTKQCIIDQKNKWLTIWFNRPEKRNSLSEILIKEMINHKLLTVKASQNIIRILPPLILEEKHVDEAILKINKAFKNL